MHLSTPRCDCGCRNKYTGEPYPKLSGPSARMLISSGLQFGNSREDWLFFYEGDEAHLDHDLARAQEIARDGGHDFHWALNDDSVLCQVCWDEAASEAQRLPDQSQFEQDKLRMGPTRLDCDDCGHKLGPLEVIR